MNVEFRKKKFGDGFPQTIPEGKTVPLKIKKKAGGLQIRKEKQSKQEVSEKLEKNKKKESEICLKESLECLISSKNAEDIREALQKIRKCFEKMGIPKFHNGEWCNTIFGYINLDGSTKYVYDPPSVEEIKKYWLSKSFSGFNDISIVFADIFRVINSLLPHLKGLKIRVPEVRVYARVYEGNEDAVKKVKELMNSNSPDVYEKFLKLWEECEDIKIDDVYVETVIGGIKRSLFGLKKELLKPVNRVELRVEFCDEDEFAFEPWL